MEEKIVKKTGERDALFDNIRAVLIFLLVLVHLIEVSISIDPVVKTVYIYLIFFLSPAFVFITGYFSKNFEKGRSEAVRRLLLPYLVLNLMAGVLDFFLNHPGHNFLTYYKITIPQWAMWYLLAMFVWRLFAGDLMKVRGIVPVSLVAGLVMPFFPDIDGRHSIGRIIGMLFYFVAGLSFRPEWIERVRKIPAWVGFAIMAAMAVPVMLLVHYNLMTQEVIYMRSPYQNGVKVVQMLMRSGCYLIASILIFATFIAVSGKQSFLSQVGRNALTVYVLHLFVLTVFRKLNILGGEPYLYIALTVPMAVLLTYLLSRMPVMRVYNAFFNTIGNAIFRNRAA